MSSGYGSALEFDRNGVPWYLGRPDLYDEYAERAWDLFYGRSGQDTLQAATAIHLRSGCRDAAYRAVKDLPHDKLVTWQGTGTDRKPTDKGVRLLLETLRQSVAKETPIRTAEIFDRTFYDSTVSRQTGESIGAYIVRKSRSSQNSPRLAPKPRSARTSEPTSCSSFQGSASHSRAR